jgi:Na+/phosphate symporter
VPDRNQNTTAALSVLIILQTVMLTALFADVAPHPPVATPMFGIAPFLGASIGTAVAAIIVGGKPSRIGNILSLAATVMALISFGPQKYLDAQFGLIWPAVIGGQIASLAIIRSLFDGLPSRSNTSPGEQGS